MAGTTTNYGWTYPTSTDLVKDGATAIQTLATGIDTTSWTTNKAGLVHLNTTTVTAAAAVNIDNVFTSTYQNYKIVFRPTAGGAAMNLETRTAGATNSLNYFTAVWGYAYTGATAGIFQNNTSSFNFLPAYTPARSSWICEVIDPKAGTTTNFQSFGSTGDAYFHGTCMFLNAASVDGVRISTSSGTFSGTIRIYGYRNS
jgi:hypothetical protein